MIEKQQDIKTQLNSLSSFSTVIIIFMCLLMCAGIIGIDFVQNTGEEYIEVESEKIENYTYAQLSKVDSFIGQHETSIQIFASLIENELFLETDISHAKVFELLEQAYINNDYIYTYVGLENKEMLMMPNDELPDDYDPTKRPWYKDAAEGEMVWSLPYTDAFTGNAIISLSKSLMDKGTGELIGVLSYDISLNELLNEVTEWHVTDAGYFVVADELGVVLSHPSEEMIGQAIPIQEISEYIEKKSSGVVKYSFSGVDKVAHIVYHEQLGFTFIYLDELASNALTGYTFSYLGIIVAGTLLMLVLVINKINSVIKSLDEATQHSNYGYTNSTKTDDKIKIKRISEELSKVLAELEELS